jgi:hypothetical protein
VWPASTVEDARRAVQGSIGSACRACARSGHRGIGSDETCVRVALRDVLRSR